MIHPKNKLQLLGRIGTIALTTTATLILAACASGGLSPSRNPAS